MFDWKRFARRERDDVVVLVTSVGCILLVWTAWLEWAPRMLAGRHDLQYNILPLLVDLFERGGDWADFSYLPGVEGGIKAADQMGVVPAFALAGALGLSPVTAINGLVFFIQTVIAFASCRLVSDLGPRDAPMPWVCVPFVAVLAAFAPLLGWKIGYGHVNVVMGAFPLVIAVMLVAASARGRLTLTTSLVAVVALLHGYYCVGHQVKLYSLVFGAPLLVALVWRRHRELRVHGVAAGVMIAPLLMSMPRFTSMLAHASGSDAARSIGGRGVIFEYVTPTVRDWLTGIPWGNELVEYGREELLHHETNYPLGPLILLLPFVASRKGAGVGVLAGLAWLVLGPILFSVDGLGVTSLLTAIVPPLESFRVPERAMVPACLLLPALAVVAIRRLASGGAAPGWKAAAPGLAAFLAAAVVPGWGREALVWGGVVAWLVARGRASEVWRPRLVVALIALLAGGGTAAFAERLVSRVDGERLVEVDGRVGRLLRRRHDELDAPLARVHAPVQVLGAGNVFRLFGLASIDGYFNPPRRFLRLFCAVHDVEFNPTINSLAPGVEKPGSKLLGELYDVVGTVERVPGGLDLARVDPPLGPAWFSDRVERLPDLDAIVAALEGAERFREDVRAVAWVDAQDGAAEGVELAAGGDPGEVVSVRRGDDFSTWKIDVRTAADRPLTVAMNYTENLRAYAASGSDRTELRTFPAYGALLGVVVPAGTESIVVEAAPASSGWSSVAYWLGLVAVAVLLATRCLDPKKGATA